MKRIAFALVLCVVTVAAHAAVKIEQTKRNFDVSFNQLKSQIQGDIEKMTNFLK